MGRTGDPYRSNLSAAAHQTEAIYRRYAIVDEAMLREVAERLAGPGPGCWRRRDNGRSRVHT